MTIRAVGGDQHYDFPLKWSAAGTAETTWTIPKSARLGEYSVTMPLKGDPQTYPNEIQTADFRVEEFRVPLMKAAIRMPAASPGRGHQLAGRSQRRVPLGRRGERIAGHAAQPGSAQRLVAFPDFEDFTFANGAVKEGTVTSEQWEGFRDRDARRASISART